MLTAEIAQEVTEKLTRIIGHNVLLTDDEGVIIGSGDSERVGDFHEPSVEVIEKKITTVLSETASWRSTKRPGRVEPGVTLAVLVEDRIVGTVGITGNPNKVDKFGMIVKSQTESMLREVTLLRSVFLREKSLQSLLYDIVTYEPEILQSSVVEARGERLGYNLNLPRVVMLVELQRHSGTEGSQINNPGMSPPELGSHHDTVDISRTIRGFFTDAQDLVAAIGSDKFAILHWIHHHDDEALLESKIRPECQQLIREIEAVHRIAATIGIGKPTRTLTELKGSYHDAWSALLLGKRLFRDTNVFYIDEFRTQELLLSAEPQLRDRFCATLLGGLREQRDWVEMRRTILAWSEAGYSLSVAAKSLGIHRNTLIYRLDKIQRLNGKGMRDYRHVTALYLACLVDELLESASSVP